MNMGAKKQSLRTIPEFLAWATGAIEERGMLGEEWDGEGSEIKNCDRTKTNNLNIYTDPEQPQQASEKKNKARGLMLPNFRSYHKATIIRQYIPAQKQTHGSMEQNREPSNKPTHQWSINLQQKRQEYTMEKK